MKASNILLLAGVILIVVGLVIALPAAYDHGFDKGIDYLRHGNPRFLMAWDSGAGDYSAYRGLEYEVARIEFLDGAYFTLTSVNEHSVTFVAPEIKRLVEKLFRRSMGEVAVIIHNHPTLPNFSPADMEALKQMRDLGFQGEWLLWHKGEITDSR